MLGKVKLAIKADRIPYLHLVGDSHCPTDMHNTVQQINSFILIYLEYLLLACLPRFSFVSVYSFRQWNWYLTLFA